MRNHIFDTVNNPFSLYQKIAADARDNYEIDVFDLIDTRDYILNSFHNWRVYSTDAELDEGNYRVRENMHRMYNNLNQDQLNQDFVAIKIGDVNGR